MIKTNFILGLGVAAVATLFAPGASAGCGQALVSKLSVMVPEARSAGSTQSTDAAIGTPEAARAMLATPAAAEGALKRTSPSQAVGLWSTSVSFGGQVIFQAFESFTSDGLEFLNDNGSTLEGNVCFGTWAASSGNSIVVYHPSWNYDMSGTLIGTVIIKSQIAFNSFGNSFTGTVVVDTYDINGKVSAAELTANLTGQRIVAN